jgi:hypothetical protein
MVSKNQIKKNKSNILILSNIHANIQVD